MDTVMDMPPLAAATGVAPRTAGPAPTRQDLPDAFAPLVRNAWYVIAPSRDVTTTLGSIKVLGEPLVYYRATDGSPIVLDDRCAHRRFALSKGTLADDVIQCGYHGFKYAQTGACIWAPGVAVRPGFGVRKYPAVERGPWVWAWMGEAERADPATIPMPDYDATETWHAGEGYKLNPGNYMLLIENLLDLTHLHFLHRITAIEQADNPAQTLAGPPNSAGWVKHTRAVAYGMLATLFGGDPTRMVRLIETDMQIGPSFNVGETTFHHTEGDDRPLELTRFMVAHAITPADETTTHQFFRVMFQQAPLHGAEAFCNLLAEKVFEEDVDAIAVLQSTVASDRRLGHVEFGIPSDRFAASIRRTLRTLRQQEA